MRIGVKFLEILNAPVVLEKNLSIAMGDEDEIIK